MLSSLIAGLVLMQAQEPAKDYKLPIMSVQEFGDWLGAQTGERIIVSADVAERSVYINVKKRTLSEVLGFVEKAVGIRVLRENGAVTLLPGPSLSDEKLFGAFDKNLDLMGDANLTEAGVEEWVMKTNELVQRMRNGDEDEEAVTEVVRLRRLDPARSLQAQVIRAIGLQNLKSIPLGHRVVYSTRPTRLQRAWPVGADQQLAWLNRMCESKNAALLQHMPDTYAVGNASARSGLGAVYGGSAKPVEAMQLVVNSEYPYFDFEFRAYDASGEMVTTDFVYFQGFQAEDDPALEYDYEATYADLEGGLELSEAELEDLRHASLFYDGYLGSGEWKRSDLEYMASVDTKHPLQGSVSKIYDYACEVTGNELVREVFDAGYWDEETVISAQGAAAICFGYEKEIKNELVVQEVDAFSQMYRNYAIPRKPIAQLARTVLRTGDLDLDTLANAVLQLPNREVVAHFVNVAFAMTGQANYGSDEGTDGETLGLEMYARLTPAQKQAARSPEGLVIDMARTSQALRWVFDDELKRAELTIGYDYNRTPEHYDESTDEQSMTWKGEQTVFLADPANLPQLVRLKITEDEAVAVSERFGEEKYDYVAMPEEVGSYLFYMEAEMEGESEGAEKHTVLFSPARRTQLGLDMMFGNLPVMGNTFTTTGLSKYTYGKLEDLPEGLRGKIREAYEKAKKEGDGGGKKR